MQHLSSAPAVPLSTSRSTRNEQQLCRYKKCVANSDLPLKQAAKHRSYISSNSTDRPSYLKSWYILRSVIFPIWPPTNFPSSLQSKSLSKSKNSASWLNRKIGVTFPDCYCKASSVTFFSRVLQRLHLYKLCVISRLRLPSPCTTSISWPYLVASYCQRQKLAANCLLLLQHRW